MLVVHPRGLPVHVVAVELGGVAEEVPLPHRDQGEGDREDGKPAGAPGGPPEDPREEAAPPERCGHGPPPL